jgi:repressor LexA
MRELTTKQQEVLGFMKSFQARHGAPPTVREIAHRFKVTPRAAFDHLRALERKGALQRRVSAGRTSRALTLVDPGTAPAYRSVPILGRIAAGAPKRTARASCPWRPRRSPVAARTCSRSASGVRA